MGPSTPTTDGTTGNGGPSVTSTAPVSVTGTSAATTAAAADTDGPDPTVTSGFQLVNNQLDYQLFIIATQSQEINWFGPFPSLCCDLMKTNSCYKYEEKTDPRKLMTDNFNPLFFAAVIPQ